MNKMFCTELNIGHLFIVVWEALQMTKTWSGECSQRRYRYRKVKEGLRFINQAQPT